MADFAATDGLYVSARWRITGGTGEYLDEFRWLAERLCGATDAFLDLLLKESPYSDGWRIKPLLASGDIEIDRRIVEATNASNSEAVKLLIRIRDEFHRRVPESARPEPGTTQRGERQLWAVLRVECCELLTSNYQPYCVISSRPLGRAQNNPVAPDVVLPVLSLEAQRKDQERRKNAKHNLEAALESYFSTLSKAAEIEITTLVQIVGAYACEIHDSAAEGYQKIPLDPEALFGMAGPLHGGLTLADVERCLSTLRIKRPWKYSSDPLVDLLDDGRELIAIYYEQTPLRREIGSIVARRVQDTQDEYERGLASLPAGQFRVVQTNDRSLGRDVRKPQLDTERINRWIEAEGYTNDTLGAELKTSSKSVSSLRNNGQFHGQKVITKLANLMKCEYPSDLHRD